MALSYVERDEVLKALGFSSYAAYLGSDLWAGIRARVLRRDLPRLWRICRLGSPQ